MPHYIPEGQEYRHKALIEKGMTEAQADLYIHAIVLGHHPDEAEKAVLTDISQGYFDLLGYRVNFKDLAWAIAIFKMVKTPEGQKNLIKILDIFKDMLKAIAQMSHHESFTATYGSLFLQGLVLRRFGLITDADFGGWIAGMSTTNALELAADTTTEIMKNFPVQFKVNLGL